MAFGNLRGRKFRRYPQTHIPAIDSLVRAFAASIQEEAMKPLPGLTAKQSEELRYLVERRTPALSFDPPTHVQRALRSRGLAEIVNRGREWSVFALPAGRSLVELHDGDPCPECHVRGDHDPSCDRDEAWMPKEQAR